MSVFTINHISSITHETLPFQKLFNVQSKLFFLKVFGCWVFLLFRPYNQHKFDIHFTFCFFLGYSAHLICDIFVYIHNLKKYTFHVIVLFSKTPLHLQNSRYPKVIQQVINQSSQWRLLNFNLSVISICNYDGKIEFSESSTQCKSPGSK